MPSTTDAPSRAFPARIAFLCALCLLILAAACGGSDVIVPPTEEFGGPEHWAVVITSDLAVGRERLAFGVGSRDGPPLQADSATVRTYFLPDNTDSREARQTLTAEFLAWPTVAGVFVAHPDFDVAGSWELEAELTTPDGVKVLAKSAFPVEETSSTPAIGAPAPASVTLRASDVEDLSHITTSGEPDPGLYALSIHEAVAEAKPFVVLFATPGVLCQLHLRAPGAGAIRSAREVRRTGQLHPRRGIQGPASHRGRAPHRGAGGLRGRMGAAHRAVDLRGGRPGHHPLQVRAIHPGSDRGERAAGGAELRLARCGNAGLS